MAKTNIFDANWVDMVFEDRNHDYGAFVLRKKQNQNTLIAIILGVAFCGLVISAPVIINYIKGFVPAEEPPLVIKEVTTLDEPPPVDEKEPPPDVPPPPPLKTTIQYTPPVIVEDKDVPEDAPPPIQDDLDTTPVSTQTVQGDPNGIDPSLLDDQTGKGTVGDDDNQVFDLSNIQQKPEFPGGDDALIAYLQKNAYYPPIALENNVQGTVRVSFVVEKDGSVSNVKAVNKPLGDGLEEEGERVVKTLPKFTPAKQNGNAVRVKMVVPVKFRLK